MYGFTDNDPYDVMDMVKLLPRIINVNGGPFDAEAANVAYPLNALVRDVLKTINESAARQGLPTRYDIAHMLEEQYRPALRDDLLIHALARTNNELHVTETTPQNLNLMDAEDEDDRDMAEQSLIFERIHPSVLDGVPIDLHREIAERLAKYYPHMRFELRDGKGRHLSERHTNRYYIDLNAPVEQRYFVLIPKEYKSKNIEIDLSPGMTLTIDSEHYSLDTEDKLVVSNRVYDTLQLFIQQSDIITAEMLQPLIKILPHSVQNKANRLRGQQLVDLLATELTVMEDRVKALLGGFTNALERRNARAARVENGPPSFVTRVKRGLIAGTLVVWAALNVVRRAVVRSFMWLYRNNIASILFYTVGATAMAHVVNTQSNILFVLWFYAAIAVFAVCVKYATRVSIIEKIPLYIYPQVYPLGTTPADVLPAVPEDAVRKAVDQASGEQPVNYDAIVQRMVIKPSWFRIAAVCIGSLEPVTYKEWIKQVRQRRSLAYDAVRLAITKQQQIGPQ